MYNGELIRKGTAMEDRSNRGRVLIVDDEPGVRRTLEHIVKRIQRESFLASNAKEARSILEEENFDLILCDLRMPGESGMDLIRHVLSVYPETAVIMISGADDPDLAREALGMGVYGYMVKPFKPSEIIINVSSALHRQRLEVEKRLYLGNLEQMVESRTAQLQDALEGVIKVLALTVEYRDPYTAGHQRSVANLACAIAEEMGCPEEQVKGIRMTGLIHDLGKITIPSEILVKPGRLSDLEFSLIKIHPQAGYDILKGIDFPWPVAHIVNQHHERMDGSGYPNGLKGEEILLEARIMAVADVVEAMASHRPYRPALGVEKALEEISLNRNVLYDDQVVEACLSLFRKGEFNFLKENRT
ncbi:MAG: response regulator [Desulfobacteraceae bacterium]|nr:response regulator [Desulfobacteraceae bacterium]